jgi:hypothetical protein
VKKTRLNPTTKSMPSDVGTKCGLVEFSIIRKQAQAEK